MCAKRLRIFAGPNGSGKSSIYRLIAERFPVGIYINADDLQADLSSSGRVDLLQFHPALSFEALHQFFDEHDLPKTYGIQFPFIRDSDGRIGLAETSGIGEKLAYAVAVLADYIRRRLIDEGTDVSFETVLSHRSKLELMRQARAAGYRVYLYYVCVASPEISKQRVALRVRQGGHSVPEDKIVERYERSLSFLSQAVSLSDRAYLFDNTYSGASLKLEINQGADVIPHEPLLPDWITRNLPKLVPSV